MVRLSIIVVPLRIIVLPACNTQVLPPLSSIVLAAVALGWARIMAITSMLRHTHRYSYEIIQYCVKRHYCNLKNANGTFQITKKMEDPVFQNGH